jgi:EpsD family peptidyl-prolyl cis-trans isomerase
MLLSAALAGCGTPAPKGQVLATVNGREVTGQDLLAEQRASGVQDGGDRRVLLQRVVSRVLLAQAAHARKLDTYPGYPSDVARVQEEFLAQKTLRSVVKPPLASTAAQVTEFMGSHPYMFASRMNIQLDEIRFQTGDGLKSLSGLNEMQAVVSRLKSLNTAFNRQTRTIDTAQLPPVVADQLAKTTIGELRLFQKDGVGVGVVVLARSPLILASDQQQTMARRLLAEGMVQGQADNELTRLRGLAKIAYQPGYAPAAR